MERLSLAMLDLLPKVVARPAFDPPEVDLAARCARLLQRFAGPELAHRTWPIAVDGSQKLPPRLLATIRERVATKQPFDCLALSVAASMRCVIGVDEAGKQIEVSDPKADRLRRIGVEVGYNAAALVEPYSAIEEIFGELGCSPTFKATVSGWLELLFTRGVRDAVAKALGGATTV